jgi:hypothetical protein
MNKRSITTALSVCVLLVLGAVIWNFWLANSPSVQVWITDWLKNPIGLTAIATVGAAIGTVGAVIVALFGIRYEQKKAQEDRLGARRQLEYEQMKAQEDRLEARRQLQVALHAANRPLLVPVPSASELEKGKLGTDILTGIFIIHNEGTGIATNVVGGCIYSDSFTIRRIASSIFKEEYKELILQEETVLDCQDEIKGYHLCSGKENTYRLVITYHDIYGRKHASIFDGYFDPGLKPPVAEWTFIAFLDDIPFDLDELIEKRKSSDETKS